MRDYEETSIRDIIDETFGPAEFEIDRALYHLNAEKIRAKGNALVYGGETVGLGGGAGRDFSWVPMIIDE